MAWNPETTELCRSYYCSHFTEEETGSEVTPWLTLSVWKDASSCTVNDYHYCPCNWPPSEKAPEMRQQPFSASEPRLAWKERWGMGLSWGKCMWRLALHVHRKAPETVFGSLGLSNLPSSTPSPPPVPAPEEISLRPSSLQGMQLLCIHGLPPSSPLLPLESQHSCSKPKVAGI